MEREERKKIYLDFVRELEVFTQKVNSLSEDSALSGRSEFLENVAQDVNRLYASSKEIAKSQDEDAEEIGTLIQAIFEQPLSVEQKNSVTIKHAVDKFSEQDATESDLSHIMRQYVRHPETTKSFIRELEILTEDMQTITRAIA